jgi:integrase
MTMRETADLYLASKANSWAPTTIKSEAARLNRIVEVCDGKTVPDQWLAVCGVYGHYARVTAWTRLAALRQWALERGHSQGVNEHARFREDNARLFKNAYQRRPAAATLQDLRAAVAREQEGPVSDKLAHLLENGLRYAESLTHKDGQVVGKGGKVRATILPNGPAKHASYAAVRAACRRLGVRPHDLRKALATDLYRRGLREIDICEVMGWSSIDTARSYVRPMAIEEVRRGAA